MVILKDSLIANNFNKINSNKILVYILYNAVRNTSLSILNGKEFEFRAEIDINSQKIHIRGSLGLDILISNKYIINEDGQIR